MSARKSKKTVSKPSSRKANVQVSDKKDQEANNLLVIPYLILRRIVGILGMALPFVLVLGGLIVFQTTLQGSLSAYYHTGMRDVFVGILWMIGIFLYSYKGYDVAEEDKHTLTGILTDNVAGNLACLFAIGVSLFPTDPAVNPTAQEKMIGTVHLIFAALFFLTLSYFCLFLFTKTRKGSIIQPGSNKIKRNRIYRVCGAIMMTCIALMAVYNLVPSAPSLLKAYRPIFVLETVAILAFGFSWLVKGETLLKD